MQYIIITSNKLLLDKINPAVASSFCVSIMSNCNAIAKELLDKGYSVVYYSACNLFKLVSDATFNRDNLSQSSELKNIYNAELLIIDDLGTELVNSLTVSQLFLCLNERLLNQKPTIISTNLSLDALVDIYSERIFSRITSNYTMLKLIGDDIRIKKKLMNMEEI